MSEGLTIEDLEERYPDPEFRRLLFRLLNIVILLRRTIIEKNYRVPPALHESIVLTEYGQSTYDQLRKRHVPYPEARMICLLETFGSDLMVDVRETDQDAIIAAIHKQILDRSLIYPFIYGRYLYDQYFDL